MKVIDLLNKIANDEEVPRKIAYNGVVFTYNKDMYDEFYVDYKDEDGTNLIGEMIRINKYDLNDTISIIEEDKKIEKLYVRERANDFLIGKSEHICYGTESYVNKIIADKINEILDKINN